MSAPMSAKACSRVWRRPPGFSALRQEDRLITVQYPEERLHNGSRRNFLSFVYDETIRKRACAVLPA